MNASSPWLLKKCLTCFKVILSLQAFWFKYIYKYKHLKSFYSEIGSYKCKCLTCFNMWCVIHNKIMCRFYCCIFTLPWHSPAMKHMKTVAYIFQWKTLVTWRKKWHWFFRLFRVFCAPEPKAQVHYCDHALSVVRPSVVHFSHFRLLLWNPWTEFNETWLEARSQCALPSLCFSGRSEKQDGRPCLWLAETFSTSPLKPLNGIQWNLTGSKISRSSTKFVFFGPIEKKRWPPWPLIGWDILDFSSETAEGNSTKLDRKQDLNVLYQVCVFWADWKNKMAAMASDWLRHLRLLLGIRWIECNEIWQEARSQGPLPCLCFSGRSEK